ncbi:MAG TPA: three-Cys-motif partner protein TcmP [Cyclobacteriaceae bacterium]|nr:three-Cys-motif partner protein TcmP [Cyclobacteriaceae bacterium]
MNLHHTPSSSFFQDDGFSVTAAEPWFKQKTNIIQQYVSSFVLNMAGRVDEIVYVDLSAGSGLFSLGAKRELFPSSALATLQQDLPIRKYVLCEKDPEQSNALKVRVNKYFRSKNVVLLDGNSDGLIDKFRLYVPQSKGAYKVSVCCVCDPFSLDVPFATIEKLANMGFSFIFPFTFALNDRLNYEYYLTEGRERLKKFLGGYRDIEKMDKEMNSNIQFYKRLIRLYENNVMGAGMNVSTSVHRLDSGLMETPQYYIGLFSSQVSTKSIQADVEASRNQQIEMFDQSIVPLNKIRS